jgi:hypothetical protein
MIYDDLTGRPMAPTAEDERRQIHQANRKKLLTGDYEDLLERELYQHLSTDRRSAWGPSDMSSNIAESITREISQLYRETPTISTNQNVDISRLTGRDGILSGYWPMMIKQQQYVLFMRESISRVDYIPPPPEYPERNGRFSYRIVTPDLVYCEASPNEPDTPNYYSELRLRSYRHPNGQTKAIYTVDIFDIRDLNNPKFSIKRVEPNGEYTDDLTEYYVGKKSLTGDDYYWRFADGMPFIPIELYHAEKNGRLWNSYEKSSLYFGALSAMVLYTFWVHIVRDSAFSIKYCMGANLAGLSSIDTDQPARRQAISTDPSSILVFQTDPDMNSQPLIGEFKPSASPRELMESIKQYEQRAAASFNISASMLRSSGDPRSGYALSIDQSGKRESQKSMGPIFSVYDSSFVAKIAALSNRLIGTTLPEEGYRIVYAPIPKSAQELEATRRDILEKMDAGLLSPVDAIMKLNPDLDPLQARAELDRIRREKIEFQT